MTTPKKKKKARQAEPVTHVALILDRSGSMMECRDATIDGFNAQRASIQANVAQGDEVRITFLSFGGRGPSGVHLHKYNRPIAELDALTPETYIPTGGTPLYDAVGEALAQLQRHDEQGKDIGFLVIILSDGQENSSTEWVSPPPKHKGEKLAARIKKLRDTGRWNFVYIGANQDLADVQRHLGVQQAVAYTPSPAGTQRLYEVSSRSLGSYLSARSHGLTPQASAVAYDVALEACPECHHLGAGHAAGCAREARQGQGR